MTIVLLLIVSQAAALAVDDADALRFLRGKWDRVGGDTIDPESMTFGDDFSWIGVWPTKTVEGKYTVKGMAVHLQIRTTLVVYENLQTGVDEILMSRKGGPQITYRKSKSAAVPAQPDRGVIRKFVEDVSISSSDKIVRRWRTSPGFSVFNESGLQQAEEAVLERIESLNKALTVGQIQFTRMAPNNESAPVRIVVVERKKFIEATKRHDLRPFGDRSWGVWKWWDADGTLIKATLIVSIEQGGLEEFQEQVCTACMRLAGVENYSREPVDSVVGPYLAKPRTEISALDVQLLGFLYLHCEPGARPSEVRRAFDAQWK